MSLEWHYLNTPISYSADPDRAMLLHKHTATLIDASAPEGSESKESEQRAADSNVKFLLLGGGGLCFSFGHHFSEPKVLSIPSKRLFHPEAVSKREAKATKAWDRQAVEWLSQKINGQDAITAYRDAWLEVLGPQKLAKVARGYLVCLPAHVKAIKVWLENHSWLLKDEKVAKGVLASLDQGAGEEEEEALLHFVDGWQLRLGEPTEAVQSRVMLLPAKGEALRRLFAENRDLSEVEALIRSNAGVAITGEKVGEWR